MKREPILIAIEGIDGAGKTFLCKNIKDCIPKNMDNIVKVIKTPCFLRKLRNIFDNMDSYGNRFLYYLIADIVDIERLKKQKYDFIFLDRYLFSTFAYHYFLIQKQVVLDILEVINIYPADITIFLKPSFETLEKRILLRRKDIFERTMLCKEFYDFFYDKALKLFEKYNLVSKYEIFENNTKGDMERIVDFIKQLIRNKYKVR